MRRQVRIHVRAVPIETGAGWRIQSGEFVPDRRLTPAVIVLPAILVKVEDHRDHSQRQRRSEIGDELESLPASRLLHSRADQLPYRRLPCRNLFWIQGAGDSGSNTCVLGIIAPLKRRLDGRQVCRGVDVMALEHLFHVLTSADGPNFGVRYPVDRVRFAEMLVMWVGILPALVRVKRVRRGPRLRPEDPSPEGTPRAVGHHLASRHGAGRSVATPAAEEVWKRSPRCVLA